LADVCYRCRRLLFAILTEAVERALSFSNKNEVLIVGGVAGLERLERYGALVRDYQAVYSSVLFITLETMVLRLPGLVQSTTFQLGIKLR
jgi:tRNA A37 threonylcarbamoyltransferase TsaD